MEIKKVTKVYKIPQVVYYGQWENPMVCTMAPIDPVPNTIVGDSPWTQGTYVVDAVSKVTGNNSQQYRFVITNTLGQVSYTAWYLITDASFRFERLASAIDTNSLYFNYIETEILVEFRNTAGPVYMNPIYISRDNLQPASIPTQAYCAVQLAYPNDGIVASTQSTYTASRPTGYIAEIGLHFGRTSVVTLLENSTMQFFLRVPSLSTVTYPGATWQVYLYQKSSILPNMSLVKQTSFTPGTDLIDFCGITSWGLIRGNNYIMRIYALNNGVIVQQPFPDINITVYMGMALQATRIGGNRGISPKLTAIGQANGVFEFLCSNFYSPREGWPLNDTTRFTEYIEIRLQCVGIDIPDNLRLTVWGDLNNPGYVCFVDSAPVFNNGTIYFKTRGRQNYSTQFSTEVIQTYFQGPSQLTFSLTFADSEENCLVCERYTSKRISLDMTTLINTAKSQQNVWHTSSSYVIEASKTVQAATSTLRFQLYVQNFNYVPPPPPPPVPPIPVKEDTIMFLVQEDAVEEIKEEIHQEPIYNYNNPQRQIVSEQALNENFLQQAIDLSKQNIFLGNAAVELYNYGLKVDPLIFNRVNTLGELLDEIKSYHNSIVWGNQLKDHWLFGNEKNMQRLGDRDVKIERFFSTPYRSEDDIDFYDIMDKIKPSYKAKLDKVMSVEQILLNQYADKRYQELLNPNIWKFIMSKYGMPYDSFNATTNAIEAGKRRFKVYKGTKKEKESYGPLQYQLSPLTLDAQIELTDQQFDKLSHPAKWYDFGSTIGIGKLAEKLGTTYNNALSFLTSTYNQVLFAMGVPMAYFMKKALSRSTETSIESYQGQQPTIFKKLWNIIGFMAMYGPSIKYVADQYYLTDIISAAIGRYQGPGAFESMYNTVSGSALTTKESVLLYAAEDKLLGRDATYVNYGVSLVKFILPDSLLRYVPSPGIQNTVLKLGAIIGLLANPAVQAGFVITGTMVAVYKAQEDTEALGRRTQQDVQKFVGELDQGVKIIISEGDKIGQKANEQAQEFRNQQYLFQETLTQMLRKSYEDGQNRIDLAREQINRDLGYTQSKWEDFNRETANLIQNDQLIQSFNKEIKQTQDKISTVVNENPVLLPTLIGTAAMLGTAGLVFGGYMYMDHLQKQQRELARQEAEQYRLRRQEEIKGYKQKQQDYKKRVAEEGEQRRLQREIDLLHQQQKTAYEGKQARIKQFKEEIRRAQELADIQNKTSVADLPYSYVSNSELRGVPYVFKQAVVSQLINHNASHGATPEETSVLTVNAQVNSIEKQAMFVHAFGNMIMNMPTLFDTYDGNQTSIVLDSLSEYLKDQMWFSKLRQDAGSYIMAKVLKAIVLPEDRQEYEIKENVKRYSQTRRTVDVKEAIQDAKKCKVEDLFYEFQNQEVINDLIRKTTSQARQTNSSFNGGLYLQDRPSKYYKTPVLPAVAPGWHFRHRKNEYRRTGFVEFKPRKLSRLIKEGDENNLLYDYQKRKLN